MPGLPDNRVNEAAGTQLFGHIGRQSAKQEIAGFIGRHARHIYLDGVTG